VQQQPVLQQPLQLQQINEDYDSDISDDPLALKDGDTGAELVAHALITHASTAQPTPTTYKPARQSGEWEYWKQAINDELAKMNKYDVWEVVNRNQSTRVVGGKWVFTRKIDGNTGKPSKYKARYVAKGFSQIEGIDYNELYAAVAHKDSIRLVLAIIAHFDLEVDQIDIVAAFLNGDLEETIYMDPPEGSPIPATKMLRLRKSLYGLKQ
jgi:hypothetical protein